MVWSAVWPALFGALAGEALHWYRLRARLAEPANRRLLRSPDYWLVTVAMIVVSGFGTALLYGASVTRPDALAVLGAAFPLILKGLIAAAGRRPPGETAGPGALPSWRRYFEL